MRMIQEETAEEIGPMGMLTKHEKSAENIAVEAKAVLEALSAGPAGALRLQMLHVEILSLFFMVC